MSKTAHTPGPWRVDKTGVVVVTDAMPPYTYGDNGEYQRPYIVCQSWMYVTAPREVACANARLIAAAPELLALLERAVGILTTSLDRSLDLDAAVMADDFIDEANAAIAAARDAK